VLQFDPGTRSHTCDVTVQRWLQHCPLGQSLVSQQRITSDVVHPPRRGREVGLRGRKLLQYRNVYLYVNNTCAVSLVVLSDTSLLYVFLCEFSDTVQTVNITFVNLRNGYIHIHSTLDIL